MAGHCAEGAGAGGGGGGPHHGAGGHTGPPPAETPGQSEGGPLAAGRT